MNYGSICSGIEAASVAWRGLGWTAKFLAEVEPFPCAVLMRRLDATRPMRPLAPEEASDAKDRKQRESWLRQIEQLPEGGTLPNLGDFTKITGEEYDGSIDLLVGGTPCQSYSLAGLRKGLADPRGNLALEFTRLAYGTGARWVLWENVPGVFSSNGGKDFASFLSLLCGWEVDVPARGWRNSGIITGAPGCFGLAWRVLDAQYVRVEQFPRAIPQRRRRVFLVGYLGDWTRAAEVLFDGEMCGGNTPPRRTKGQDPSSCASLRPAEAMSLQERAGKPGGGKGALISIERCNALATCNNPKVCIDMREPNNAEAEISPTLKATDFKGGKIVGDVPELCPRRRCLNWDGSEVAGTFTTRTIGQTMPDKGQLPCVIEQRCYENHGNDSRIRETEVSPTITSRAGTGGNNLPYVQDPPSSEASDDGSEERTATVGIGRDAFNSGANAIFGMSLSENVQPPITARGAAAVAACDSGGSGTRNQVFMAKSRDGFAAEDVSKTLLSNTPSPASKQGGAVILEETTGFIKNDAGGEQQHYSREVFPTLRTEVTPAVFRISSNDSEGMKSANPKVGFRETDISNTLDAHEPSPGKSQGGLAIVAHDAEASDHDGDALEECVPVSLRLAMRKGDERRTGLGVGKDGEPANTVLAGVPQSVGYRSIVRKLLPIETERLMGFPDNWTRIAWKGKPEEQCPDAPRYKACGNSMVTSVMSWLGERIQMVEDRINGGS